jgi:hypothetical protein
MALETDVRTGLHLRGRANERQFRWLYALTFTISLVHTLLARLSPWRDARDHRSIIDETKARTARIVPFLFMG